jgi:hypothetical protein
MSARRQSPMRTDVVTPAPRPVASADLGDRPAHRTGGADERDHRPPREPGRHGGHRARRRGRRERVAVGHADVRADAEAGPTGGRRSGQRPEADDLGPAARGEVDPLVDPPLHERPVVAEQLPRAQGKDDDLAERFIRTVRGPDGRLHPWPERQSAQRLLVDPRRNGPEQRVHRGQVGPQIGARVDQEGEPTARRQRGVHRGLQRR